MKQGMALFGGRCRATYSGMVVGAGLDLPGQQRQSRCQNATDIAGRMVAWVPSPTGRVLTRPYHAPIWHRESTA